MTNELKQRVMNEIEAHSSVFIKVNQIQYRIRCPICGDSQKNLRDAHCYIKFSYDASEPLLYHCFKCNASGIVNRRFLKKLQITGDILNQISSQRYNKIQSYKNTDVNIITGDPVLDSLQVKYLEKRIGRKFTSEDLDTFKIVWNMSNLYPYINDQRTKNSMPNNNESISFLSDNKGTLLTRFFDDKIGRWRKINLFPAGKAMYTLKTTFDLFNTKLSDKPPSEVWIAEGVIDIISLYMMRKEDSDIEMYSAAYIAILGRDYIGGVEYIISKGMFGKWIDLNICIDSNIDIETLISQLRNYKWLFKSIRVIRNRKDEDFGVTPDRILLSTRKVV